MRYGKNDVVKIYKGKVTLADKRSNSNACKRS